MKFLALSLIIWAATNSQAMSLGTRDGGGGKSLICRNTQGVITRSEVLDLYEGRVLEGLTYNEDITPWFEQGLRVLEASGVNTQARHRPNLSISDWYYHVAEEMSFATREVKLKDVDDSKEYILPKTCRLEQAAIFVSDTRIVFDAEIWASFSETQKAALVIHEAIYRYLRERGDVDSRRARRLTAHMFAGMRIEPELFPGEGMEAFCESDATIIYVMPPFKDASGKSKLRLYFAMIGARTPVSQTYVELFNQSASGNSFIDLLKGVPGAGKTSYQVETQALFEANEQLDIVIDNSEESGAKLFIGGRSNLNGESFFEELDCRFY